MSCRFVFQVSSSVQQDPQYPAPTTCVVSGHLHAGQEVPDSKVHGANMGPIWGRQDPDGPHAGPMIFAIWGGN